MMNKDIITIVVQIGNSDDKLSQKEWSSYVNQIHENIKIHARQMHFFGGSPNWYPEQNACFVLEMSNEFYISLCSELKDTREYYNQDSIALVHGDTILL